MKILISLIISTFAFVSIESCKKMNSCLYDSCDPKRKTVLKATEWTGTLGYYNDIRKWAINVAIPNSIDGIRTCIICTDIPDSLKVVGSFVTFSGELKESCNNPKPELRGQEIYFVKPTTLKK